MMSCFTGHTGKKGCGPDWQKKIQLMVLTKFQSIVLKYAHDHPVAGHLSQWKTLQRISELFYFPNQQKKVQQWVTSCSVCQIVGRNGDEVKIPLQNFKINIEPFQEVCLDLLGPLHKTKMGKCFILTIVD